VSNLVLYSIPAFLVLIALEFLWARRHPELPGYERRDTVASLSLGIGNVAVSAGAKFLSIPFFALLYEYRVLDLGQPAIWWSWLVLLVAEDFCYYWFHRTHHEVRVFWAAHVNHHSSQHYNLSTALRQTWTGFIALSFVFRLPLAAAGFEPGMILTCAGFNLIYQFWIHTEAIGRMPRWFEAIMNTPSHHRVHHATNACYLDRNYAGTFIVWDKLFGTFVRELDGERIRYGLVRQLGSFNIFHAAFHEWIGIARDLIAAPWRHKLSYLWREPGWSHDGSRETSDMIRARQAGSGTASPPQD
jgi:sterol desaturase/sphingolipid hydroxylase (fatty acid hydroxylase superfamily)